MQSPRKRKKQSPGGHLHKRLNGKYLTADSPVVAKYYCSIMVNGHRRLHSLDTFDISEAKEKMAELVAGKVFKTSNERYLKNLVRLGEWAKEQLGSGIAMGDGIAITQAWDAYERSRRRPNSGPRTMKEYKTRWRLFSSWCETHGLKKMRDVLPHHAEDYSRYLEKPTTVKVKYGKHKESGRRINRTAETVNTHLQLLRLIYRVLDPGWPNPFAGVASVIEDQKTPYRKLTLAEVKKLWRTAEGDYKVLLLIGYTTGLRLIDAATLRWEHVDMKRGIISLSPRKTARRKKGESGIVYAPIVEPLLSALKRVKAKDRAGFVLKDVGPLYSNRSSQSKVNKTLTQLFKSAKVVENERGKASFRALRVTWQSMNDEAGTNRVLARSVLGHSGPEMSDTYSRLDDKAAIDAVSNAIKW